MGFGYFIAELHDHVDNDYGDGMYHYRYSPMPPSPSAKFQYLHGREWLDSRFNSWAEVCERTEGRHTLHFMGDEKEYNKYLMIQELLK